MTRAALIVMVSLMAPALPAHTQEWDESSQYPADAPIDPRQLEAQVRRAIGVLESQIRDALAARHQTDSAEERQALTGYVHGLEGERQELVRLLGRLRQLPDSPELDAPGELELV